MFASDEIELGEPELAPGLTGITGDVRGLTPSGSPERNETPQHALPRRNLDQRL